MPPQMKRQNAFNDEQPEPFSIACRICYQNEACGDWIRVTCQCSIIDDYYHAHEFCLQRNRKCKVCSTPFVKQSPPPPPPSSTFGMFNKLDIREVEKGLIKYKYHFIGGIMVLVFLLKTMYRVYQCTAIELVDEVDDIWLPVEYQTQLNSSDNTTDMLFLFSFAGI